MSASMQPMYGASIPLCVQVFPIPSQSQTYGGTSVGDGMAQSGPSVSARTEFLAALASYVTEPFTAISTGIRYNPTAVSILGGVGSWYGVDIDEFTLGQVEVSSSTADGRFNTSANAAGRYGVTYTNSIIDLTGSYTAFGMYYTDLGDFGGELEIDFFSGSTLRRTITAPTRSALEKSGAGSTCFLNYVNGGQTFNKVVIKLRQFFVNAAQTDYVGYDDITVGQFVACTSVPDPVIYYGINTTSTTAKTVAGPAKTARDSWAAAAGTVSAFDFEDQSVASYSSSLTLATPGPGTCNLVCRNHRSTTSPSVINVTDGATIVAAVANSGASDRWNTSSSGSKWLEWTDEVILTLDNTYTKIGFYVTDLGNQNATLRITLRNNTASDLLVGAGAAFVHYMPKAAELNSPAGLLRFWGITGEQSFNELVLQVVYYDDLTAGTYAYKPAWNSGNPIETVGIDDIMIGF